MWNLVFEHFRDYVGYGLIMIYYLFALVYLFIREKRKERRILFVYMPLIVLVLFLNPLFAKFITQHTEDAIYYRFLWLLPVSATIAYTLTELFISLEKKFRIPMLIIASILLILGGRLVYSDGEYSVAENKYHIPQSVVDICDTIHEPGREVFVAFPTELLVYVRQYDPTVKMPYGYDEIKNMNGTNRLRYYLDGNGSDIEKICVLASNCHYFVTSDEYEYTGSYETYGFIEYAHVDGYTIYRNIFADFSQ